MRGESSRCLILSAVTIHTEDGRYNWLNKVTGVWQGTFDMSAYQHHYQVFVTGDV